MRLLKDEKMKFFPCLVWKVFKVHPTPPTEIVGRWLAPFPPTLSEYFDRQICQEGGGEFVLWETRSNEGTTQKMSFKFYILLRNSMLLISEWGKQHSNPDSEMSSKKYFFRDLWNSWWSSLSPTWNLLCLNNQSPPSAHPLKGFTCSGSMVASASP